MEEEECILHTEKKIATLKNTLKNSQFTVRINNIKKKVNEWLREKQKGKQQRPGETGGYI